MSTNRLYTEKEISAILKRSGEIQAKQGEKETHGLSLDELQQIAQEVGLDPAIIAQVAGELDGVGGQEDGNTLFGVPIHVDIERILPGEVAEEQWPEIVAEIGRSFGMVGVSGQVGRMLEWTYTSRQSQLQVSLTPGDGQTKVRIFGNYSKQAKIFLFVMVPYALFLGGLFSTTAGLPILGGAGIGLAASLLVYMLIHFGYGSFVRKKERQARQLLKRLEEMVPVQAISAVQETEPLPEPEGRISLPEDQAEEEKGPKTRNRERNI